MSRIRFEDLPSINTPITAENLDKLNNVVISPTEPTTGEEVWFKKGKNLVNVSQIILGYALWSTDGTILIHAERGYFEYILVNSNTEYSISNCTPTAICFYDKNKSFISAVTGVTAFTTPSDCTYIRFAIDITKEYSNIQFEQGAVATDYEPYIEPEIYILNNNNVYEKFEKNKERILFNFNNYTNWNINTNYIQDKNGFTRFDVNSIFCFANLNFKITVQAPTGTVLLSNLPKPKNRITFCAALDFTLVKLYIDTNGELRADGNISATGWLSCNISYLLN